MKFGLRTPSVSKMIAARVSPRRYARQNLGIKVLRGWGWITNPKMAAYNRVHRRTTFSIWDLFMWLLRGSGGGRRRRKKTVIW